MPLLKKLFRLPVLLIPLLILFPLFGAYGQEENIILEQPGGQRPAVDFPHELHMGELDCLDCHHDYDENGENVLDEDSLEEGNDDLKCDACHDASTKIDLRSAFHKKCMGCHIELRKENKPTGPELCGECHKK